MISRKNRFHGYGSLKHVYRNGQAIRGPLFSVRYLENPKRKDYRVAVVVSRKVNKSAVARNRIRRRLYEIIRTLGIDIVRPFDIVINVFHDTVQDEPPQRLEEQLKRQLKEAGVLVKRITRES